MERWYPQGQTQPSVSASPWDILIVNGTYLPGRARITRAAAAWKIDPKRKPGADAHRPTKLGFEPKPIGFEILCVTLEDVNAVNEILSPYYPAPGGVATPIQISHPSIDHLRGVQAMTILEVSAWELQSDRRVKLTVSGETWVASAKPTKDGKVVTTATKTDPQNARRKDAEKRGLIGGQNPQPAQQNGFCAPNFTPGA